MQVIFKYCCHTVTRQYVVAVGITLMRHAVHFRHACAKARGGVLRETTF